MKTDERKNVLHAFDVHKFDLVTWCTLPVLCIPLETELLGIHACYPLEYTTIVNEASSLPLKKQPPPENSQANEVLIRVFFHSSTALCTLLQR